MGFRASVMDPLEEQGFFALNHPIGPITDFRLPFDYPFPVLHRVVALMTKSEITKTMAWMATLTISRRFAFL